MKRIILLIFVVLLISSCERLPKLPGLDGKTPVIFGGNEAISATIDKPEDDSIMPAGYNLEPVIRIKNLGGSDAEGQVCISGLNRNIFSGFSGCECSSFQQLAEDTYYEPEDMRFGSYTIREAQSGQKYTLTAVTRYRYNTVIKAKICFVEGDDCYATKESVTSGPLDVGSIKETIFSRQGDFVSLVFTIDVDKGAEGRFIPLENVNVRCEPTREDIEREKKIRAQITSFPVSGDISCKDAVLKEDEAIITCEARDIRMYDARGNYLFAEDYRPEITFKLEYAFETTDSSSFELG